MPIGTELCSILTFGGGRVSRYGFPVERGALLDPAFEDRLGIEIVPESGGGPIPVQSEVQTYHFHSDVRIEDPAGVTVWIPADVPAGRYFVRARAPFAVTADRQVVDAKTNGFNSPERPRPRWIEDLVGARVVDEDHGALRWHVERVGPVGDDPAEDALIEGTASRHGVAITEWEAQGWLRDRTGAPIVFAWVTLTTFPHTSAVHVEVNLRNQAPRGKKWGTRLLRRIAFEPFVGWRFEVPIGLWDVGYSGENDWERVLVFEANGDELYPMAEADGMVVEFVAHQIGHDPFAAVMQPFGVENAWEIAGWGYTDGLLPPPIAWQHEPEPPRLKPLYADRLWCIRANDSEGASPDDWYSIPRIVGRAEDVWHHRAGAPHRNDLWDVPFIVRPSESRSGYVEDLRHYAKSFREMPHQTTILDPETGKIVRFDLKWGETKDSYNGGRPSIRRNANDPDELSFEACPRRWTVWENPGSNMTLDREHGDLACMVQALLVTGDRHARRWIEARHYMTGLDPDGAGVAPASSDRMLAWYLQHHEQAARVCRDRTEAHRRLRVGLACIMVNAKLAGQVRENKELVPAPTVNGVVPLVMFLTGGTWSGWAGWMVALQWQLGVLPVVRAAVQAGIITSDELRIIREVFIATCGFVMARDTYYDATGGLAAYDYKLHPHGRETIASAAAKRFEAVHWGEGDGPHSTGHVGEAYHPTESRVALNGSMSWFVEFWAAIPRFLPAAAVPPWILDHVRRVVPAHLRAIQKQVSGFHPYRASSWRVVADLEALSAMGDAAVAEASPDIVSSGIFSTPGASV